MAPDGAFLSRVGAGSGREQRHHERGHGNLCNATFPAHFFGPGQADSRQCASGSETRRAADHVVVTTDHFPKRAIDEPEAVIWSPMANGTFRLLGNGNVGRETILVDMTEFCIALSHVVQGREIKPMIDVHALRIAALSCQNGRLAGPLTNQKDLLRLGSESWIRALVLRDE